MKNLIFILSLALLLASCEPALRETEIPIDENGNFVLYMTNQSFDVDPVDIQVLIDGKVAVDQDFFVYDQHHYESFRFSLSGGTHTIKMLSEKGEATLEDDFTITEASRGIIEYWYYPDTFYDPTPKHFTFSFGPDEPLMID